MPCGVITGARLKVTRSGGMLNRKALLNNKTGGPPNSNLQERKPGARLKRRGEESLVAATPTAGHRGPRRRASRSGRRKSKTRCEQISAAGKSAAGSKSKHRQTTQAYEPRPTGAHSTKTSTSKSLPALVAAEPERKNKALLKS
jgi:hypothetical protein